MRHIHHETFDQERALYGQRDIQVTDCAFDGPADGESAFKEGANIQALRCFFNLRYPFWHDDGLVIRDSELTPMCRAALWYSHHIEITNTKLHGIKALRECGQVALRDCDEQIEEMRTQYGMRRRYLVRAFNEMGLHCFEPEGAFYVFPSIAVTGLSSEEFCQQLLYTQRVAVVPGTAFGDSGEGFVRVSYAYSVEHLQEAVRRIREFLKQKDLL